MTTLEEGRKADAEKIQLELLTPRWIYGVGHVLTLGAKKYAAFNWAKGIKRTRLIGAALRHIFTYLGGEDNDSESGLLHLYHASCELMFASELHYSRPDLDDRYGQTQSGTPKTEKSFLMCSKCTPFFDPNRISSGRIMLAYCEHGELKVAEPL